jgi:prepilin-type N-terminal cleavage/methylation domain-containing protein
MKRSTKKITRRGFTIVELLVVISIMAIVATPARFCGRCAKAV